MDPDLDPVDTVGQENPLLYPNPGSLFISAVLPGSLTGEVNIRVFNNTGMKMADYNKTLLSGVPVILDIRSLSAGVYTVVFTRRSAGLSFRSRFIVVRGP